MVEQQKYGFDPSMDNSSGDQYDEERINHLNNYSQSEKDDTNNMLDQINMIDKEELCRLFKIIGALEDRVIAIELDNKKKDQRIEVLEKQQEKNEIIQNKEQDKFENTLMKVMESNNCEIRKKIDSLNTRLKHRIYLRPSFREFHENIYKIEVRVKDDTLVQNCFVSEQHCVQDVILFMQNLGFRDDKVTPRFKSAHLYEFEEQKIDQQPLKRGAKILSEVMKNNKNLNNLTLQLWPEHNIKAI